MGDGNVNDLFSLHNQLKVMVGPEHGNDLAIIVTAAKQIMANGNVKTMFDRDVLEQAGMNMYEMEQCIVKYSGLIKDLAVQWDLVLYDWLSLNL
jgi:hypothetical protein